METFKFETEISKLLDLMINSLYSNQEIFLRELISNASDALDKLKFLSQTDSSLLNLVNDLKINIKTDETRKTIEISDNGIGMTHEELKNNLGTIAKSGTLDFLKQINKNNKLDTNFIGQFGVGFYSSFMVSKKVEVLSKSINSDKAYIWTSTADGTYSIKEVNKETNGTSVILYLKNDLQEDYTAEYTINNLIKKYSNFIAYPIVAKKTIYKEENKKEETLETINSMQAIWLKSSNELSKEQYYDFYKQTFNDYTDPLFYIHTKMEGKIEFNALLYVPSKQNQFFFEANNKHGLNLYSKKVFIMKECENLIPDYLRFIKGVVDANDLNLNISREILQQDKIISQIKNNLIKKVLDKLGEILKNNKDEYIKFFTEYGKILKEGIASDFENKEKLSKLLMYKTNKSNNTFITLNDYINNMKLDQKNIYYITGETYETLLNSPLLESLKELDYEVLIMTDPVDEWVINYLHEFDNKKLQSAEKNDLDLNNAQNTELNEDEFKILFEKINKVLENNIKTVKASKKLKDSIAVFTSDENEMSSYMEKILKASGQAITEKRKRILEINTKHPFIIKLNSLKENNDLIDKYSKLFYDLAVISEGGKLDNPSRFNSLIGEIISV